MKIVASRVREREAARVARTPGMRAALAIEHGCEWWTADADFARFSGLRWRNVLAR
ncbi:MAG: hypothetical protein ABJA82_13005 [Myxococcales bacterium]